VIIQGVVFSSTFKEEYGGKAESSTERAKDTGIRPLKFEETLQYVIP